MEKDNVVNLHPKYDSHYRADGSALLTDKLDPVLFAEYVNLKKLLDENKAERGSYRLPDGSAKLTDVLDPVLFVEYVKQKRSLKYWRWIANMWAISFLLVLYTPQIVRAFFPW